jgi:simple sugar transport system ATP-binding protein
MAAKSYMRVENVVKKFGPFTAVDGVDLDIAPGEVHALLGDNGAGKSTLIKIMSGVHQPTSGSIYVDDKKSFSETHGTLLQPVLGPYTRTWLSIS